MRLLQLAALLLLSVTSIKTTESCEIASNTLTAHGRVIDVTCEPGMNFSLKMEDGDELSTLEVFGKRMEEGFEKLLKAERYGKSSNMSLTLLAKRLDDRDEKPGDQFADRDEKPGDQSAALGDLLDNPYFTRFPTVARLIHDELQLPGWESPSVMMLYHIGMSLHDHQPSRKRRQYIDEDHLDPQTSSEYQTYGHTIDDRIDDYHGRNPTKDCEQDGKTVYEYYAAYYSGDYLGHWMRGKCYGMCGPECSCWKWFCGDCCIHEGCKTHDDYCAHKYLRKFHPDCWLFQGLHKPTGTYSRRITPEGVIVNVPDVVRDC